MNRSLRIASFLICAASAAATAGCVVTVEPLVRYEGTDESARVEYLPDQSVRVESANGSVEVVTGNVSEVEVTFSPFTMRKEGEGELAEVEIEEQLELVAITSGDVVIQAKKVANGASLSGYLGADIRVVLPSSFNGELIVAQNNGGVEVDLGGAASRGVTITSENGSVDVAGAQGTIDVTTDNGSIDVADARGALDVETGNGSVAVEIDAWSSSDGLIKSGNGGISLTVPAGVDGTMTALTESGVVNEQGIPSTWATAGDGGATSYTMGDGDGGQLDLFTELGDIDIIVK